MSAEIEILKKALETGNLDRKKHWGTFQKTVKKARKSGSLTKQDIKTLAEIDKQFFQEWKVSRMSIFWGSIFLTVLTFLSESLYLLTLFEIIPLSSVLDMDEWNLTLGLLMFFVSSGISYYSSHALIHFVIGRPLGIRFHQYFIFRASFRKIFLFKRVPPFSWFASIPMWFGIKYDLESFLSVAKWKRTLMFISAPIISNLWFLINYAFLITFNDSWNSAPPSLQASVLILILGFYAGGLLLSFFKYGDLWKARQDY